MPKVSVIVAAYNAEPFIQRAVKSVLAQSLSDLEVIIVDDGSSDGTAALTKEMSSRDTRIKLIQTAENKGVGAARNLGLDHSVGEWIAILDADDWIDPDRMEVLIGAAEKDGAILAADNQYIYDGLAEKHWRLLKDHVSSEPPSRLAADDLLNGDRCGQFGNLGLLKPIVRRDFLCDHNIKYDEGYGLGEDFYFLLMSLKFAPYILFIKQPFYHYRIHANSTSGRSDVRFYSGLLAMHERHNVLFDPRESPRTAQLMERRSTHIIQYIRSQHVVARLKNRQYLSAMRFALTDPGTVPQIVTRTLGYTSRKIRKSLSRTILG